MYGDTRMTIVSFASFGYEGEIIKVEADLRRGLPIIDIVGLPGSAVKEARERMRAAITNSHLPFPQERILINLSPADQRKEGSGYQDDCNCRTRAVRQNHSYRKPCGVDRYNCAGRDRREREDAQRLYA